MAELAKAPTPAYWNELRGHERALHEETVAHASVLYGVEALAVWKSGAADGVDVLDLVQYQGQASLMGRSPRAITLATFNEPNIPKGEHVARGEVRIYDLRLPQDRETLTVYAAWLPLSWYGLCPESAVLQRKAKKFYEQAGEKGYPVAATERDYGIVREQFKIGASGLDRIKHPNES